MSDSDPVSLPITRRTFTAGLAATALLSGRLGYAQDLQSRWFAPPALTDKLIVYQIFTRLFGNQQTANKPWGSLAENGVGKFNDVTDKALQEIKKLGTSHIWYTGIIEHATMTGYTALGIPPDNPLVVKGRAGSPYAIKDYYDVAPDLAVDVRTRMAEFEALVARTHANGLRVIIDFVPNHLARQYHSDAKPTGVADLGQTDDTTKPFDPNNNFYYLPGETFQPPATTALPPGMPTGIYTESPAKATGNDVFTAKPSPDDWYETIKLNYGVDYSAGKKTHFEPDGPTHRPDTWNKMRDILLFWAAKGVDGFRCDMAEMVPVEFWGWVIPQIKASRGAANASPIFIAEIYNPAQYENYIRVGQFDYLYDKVGLYDAVRGVLEGKIGTKTLSAVCRGESGTLARHMLRFLENHDEQRLASRQFAGNPRAGIPAMTLSATLHTGPIMLYFGQEVGVTPTQAEGFQGDDGRTTIFDYWGVPEFQAWVNGGRFDGGKLTAAQKNLRTFYAKLGQLVRTSEAIRTGEFIDLQQYGPTEQAFCYLRHTNRQRLLIVCNFDPKNSLRMAATLPPEAVKSMTLKPAATYLYRDIFLTNTRFKAGLSVPVSLPPLGVLVLNIS